MKQHCDFKFYYLQFHSTIITRESLFHWPWFFIYLIILNWNTFVFANVHSCWDVHSKASFYSYNCHLYERVVRHILQSILILSFTFHFAVNISIINVCCAIVLFCAYVQNSFYVFEIYLGYRFILLLLLFVSLNKKCHCCFFPVSSYYYTLLLYNFASYIYLTNHILTSLLLLNS